MSQETKEQEIKWNLACGDIKMDGFKGVDIAKTDSTDVVLDLINEEWSFAEDGTVDEFWVAHFFEHMDGPERIRFMEKCYNKLKEGAKMTIISPYYTSMRAIQDPTHKWPPISEASFLYFNKDWMEQNKLSHYGINADFDFTYGYAMSPEVQGRNAEFQSFAVKNYTNSVQDIQVVLTKKTIIKT